MAEGKRITFDADGAFEALKWLGSSVLEVVKLLFRPVHDFMHSVMTSGTAGFLAVFVIFFLLMLLRRAASSQRSDVFLRGLHTIGCYGLGICGLYVCLLALERTLVPLLVVAMQLGINSLFGMEPGLQQFWGFLFSSASPRFFLSLFGFALGNHSVLPLSFYPLVLLATAFGCMWFLGKTLAPQLGHPGD